MSYLGQQLVVLFCCSVSTVQLADRLMRILGCRLCPGTTRERDGVCVCVWSGGKRDQQPSRSPAPSGSSTQSVYVLLSHTQS